MRVESIDRGIITNGSTAKVVWANGRNVRFRPGEVYSSPGKSLLATTPGNLPVREMFTFRGHDRVVRTIACCDNKIFSYTNNFTSRQDITPTPVPSSGASDVWQFELIGGMPIISNGVNPMWKWSNFSNALTPLSNAPAKCRVLGASMNRLIVGDISEPSSVSGAFYDWPARIRWPEIAKPENWTIDRKMKSGRQDIIDPGGGSDSIEFIRAFTAIGNRTRIYTSRNIWHMDPAEFPNHYRFDLAYRGIGLLGRRLRVSVQGIDYFMGDDDFYVLPPASAPVPFGYAIRNTCFSDLNLGAMATAFAFEQPDKREIGFCVPTGTNTAPDTAYIYQRETKAWTICDVNYTCFNDSRAAVSDTAGLLPYPVVGNALGQILKFDSTDDDNGTAVVKYIESGDEVGSSNVRKKISYGVIPEIITQLQASRLIVQIGSKDNLSDDIEWSVPVPYVIGVDKIAKVVKKGNWLRLRFYSDELGAGWTMSGYEWIVKEAAFR